MDAKEFAKNYYKTEFSDIQYVTIQSTINFAEKYHALQLQQTGVSGSFFDLIEESLKKDAIYYGQMSLKDSERCQEYILKSEEYLNAIDWLRNYR
jgi:hypothetical protein